MNIILNRFILVFIGIFSCLLVSAANVSSAGTGDWEAGGTWEGGSVPAAGDVITIAAGHTVTVTTNNATLNSAATELWIYGVLDFTSGSKLQMGCGSGIYVAPGGLISSEGSGGGASNNIKICGVEVWRKSDGDAPGPQRFGFPLPVQLLYFNAEVEDNSVRINWSTASELNNDYFELMKSSNGLSFNILTEVDGAGTTNETNFYEYETDLDEGTTYFKLKQIDFDGASEEFKIIAVEKITDNNNECKLTVYPNPCPGNCKVKLKDCPLENSSIRMMLMDASGVGITSVIKEVDYNGEFDFDIDRSNNLKPGIYILSGEVDGTNKTTKVVVQ